MRVVVVVGGGGGGVGSFYIVAVLRSRLIRLTALACQVTTGMSD